VEDEEEATEDITICALGPQVPKKPEIHNYPDIYYKRI